MKYHKNSDWINLLYYKRLKLHAFFSSFVQRFIQINNLNQNVQGMYRRLSKHLCISIKKLMYKLRNRNIFSNIHRKSIKKYTRWIWFVRMLENPNKYFHFRTEKVKADDLAINEKGQFSCFQSISRYSVQNNRWWTYGEVKL